MMIETIGSLALVFGLLAALRWWAGRTPSTRNQEGPLLVEQRIAAVNGHTLLLVRIGRKRLLVACGPSGTSLLTELTVDQQVAKATAGDRT